MKKICKNCNHRKRHIGYPSVRHCVCKKITDYIRVWYGENGIPIKADFGCIHWEKKK